LHGVGLYSNQIHLLGYIKHTVLIILPHLEHSFSMTLEIGKFWNMVLEKDGKDQLNQWSGKWSTVELQISRLIGTA